MAALTEEDPLQTLVIALTQRFADIQVAEKHVADTELHSATESSSSRAPALHTADGTGQRAGRPKRQTQLAVMQPRIAERSDDEE